jgi:hypothetical protein
MSLKPEPIDSVPEETARIARAAYPKGNTYLQLRDTFGTIYQDEQFVELYPQRGHSGLRAPRQVWREQYLQIGHVSSRGSVRRILPILWHNGIEKGF